MQVQFKTTNNHHHKFMSAKSGRETSTDTRRQPLSWKPQASGLTRDEMRAAVLEMIG